VSEGWSSIVFAHCNSGVKMSELSEKGAAEATYAANGAPANELAVLGYHEELKRNRNWLTILSQSLVISSVRLSQT
jgi:hypothetical protein